MTTSLIISVAAPPKSKTERIRDLLPGIEAALDQGHGHQVIYDHLRKIVGLELTFQYYKITLHRLRKKRESAKPTGKNVQSFAHPAKQIPGKEVPQPGVIGTSSAGGARFSYDVKASVEDFFS